MDRPDWPHFADAMITYRGGAAQGPRAVRASALGGPGAGYIRPCSGTGASLGVLLPSQEVATFPPAIVVWVLVIGAVVA